MKRTYRQFLVHLIADCEDCSWYTEDYQTGAKEAAKHARLTGHRVSGEKEYAFRYNEKEE